MISYKLFDSDFYTFSRQKDSVKDFVEKWELNYETLKELLTYGELVVLDKFKIYLNINNYKYRNLLKRELINNSNNDEIKKLIGEL